MTSGPAKTTWSNNDISDTALEETTHGSGTTAERNAVTSWAAGRPFFDTDLNQWFYNSHVSAPSSITWTNVNLPQKRRFFVHFYITASAALTFMTPNTTIRDGTSRADAEMTLTSEDFTVVRMRIRTNDGGSASDSYRLFKDGTAVNSETGSSSSAYEVDSGAISVAYTSSNKMSMEVDMVSSGTEGVVILECEYDDIY